MRSITPLRRVFACLVVLALLCVSVRAEDIEGVQPAALDQPRINVLVRLQPKGTPLSANVVGTKTFNVQAFLDTGASGVMLSPNTVDQLGIKKETVAAAGKSREVQFEDVGVGGGDKFDVSDPIYLSIAPYDSRTDIDDPNVADTVFNLTVGPLRAQVGPLGTKDLLMSLAMGDLDVVGMPAMRGKVVVCNVAPVNSFSDTIRTSVYDARNAQGVPKTKRHVKLSFASFAAFTKTDPPNAASPSIAPNPFIGPNPLATLDPKQPAGDAPPVTATHHGKSLKGSWLLDTGAVASMISRANAEKLGVQYAAGTWGTDHPELQGVPADQQFTLTIGGVGGSHKVAGFYLDSLRLETSEREPLIFKRAPVLVSDVTVRDSATGKELTLDGVFGMNFLVASAMVSEGGLMPDIKNLTAGAFKWVVFDEPDKWLGLD